MLHVNFHVRYVKSNPFKSNQVTKSGGVKGEGQNASCQITEQFSEPLRHGSRKPERARCCKITKRGSTLLGSSTCLNRDGGEAYTRDSSKMKRKRSTRPWEEQASSTNK